MLSSTSGATGFYPASVRAEPFKINIYGPGGRFQRHRDTPATNMVGTFLICLFDSTKGASVDPTKSSYLQVGSDFTWKSEAGSWVAFHPDQPHEIGVIASGYRVTLAYKVFADVSHDITGIDLSNLTSKDAKQALAFHDIVKRFQSFSQPFGILLTHQYSIESTALQGQDAILAKALSQLPDVEILNVPVAVHGTGSYAYEEPTTCSSAVYPMTPQHLKFLLDGTPIDDEFWRNDDEQLINIPFYTISNGGFCWSQHSQDAIEYTGNEAQPGEQEMVYLYHALVVLRKGDEQPKKKTKRDQS